MYIYLVQA